MRRLDPVISMIVAVSENGIIGRDGDMPWRLSSDLKRFKALTLGHPVIMGRKTFESIGKPLPNRLNIVITRDMDWATDGAMRVSSLGAAIELATANLESIHDHADDDADPDELPKEVFIIGGGQIYAQAIDYADALYVTEVLAEIDGDTSYPENDENQFEPTHWEDVPKGEKDSHDTRFVIWERREAAQ
ncbi:MAG: dihydrofolate reductase [Pseudomonadota bacterium]